MSRIPDADERIARILGQRQGHPIVVEQGQDALPPSSPAAAGQTNASLTFDAAEANRADAAQRAEAAAKKAAVKEVLMPSSDPVADLIVTVGPLQIYPNPIQNGWERNATKDGHASHFVMFDGERVAGPNAVGVIYEALLLAQRAQRKAK